MLVCLVQGFRFYCVFCKWYIASIERIRRIHNENQNHSTTKKSQKSDFEYVNYIYLYVQYTQNSERKKIGRAMHIKCFALYNCHIVSISERFCTV